MKYTDNQNEPFDIVDENDQVIGQTRREEVHKNKKLIHRSIGVCVFNSKGEIYLQKRSTSKDTDPGKWTISCSGHVSSGVRCQVSGSRQNFLDRKISRSSHYSLYKDTAHRELKEELGVSLRLEFVTKYLCKATNETEMSVLFKAYSNGPFKLHPQEIEEGKFFTQKELKEALRKRKIELSFMGKAALTKIGWI